MREVWWGNRGSCLNLRDALLSLGVEARVLSDGCSMSGEPVYSVQTDATPAQVRAASITSGVRCEDADAE